MKRFRFHITNRRTGKTIEDGTIIAADNRDAFKRLGADAYENRFVRICIWECHNQVITANDLILDSIMGSL